YRHRPAGTRSESALGSEVEEGADRHGLSLESYRRFAYAASPIDEQDCRLSEEVAEIVRDAMVSLRWHKKAKTVATSLTPRHRRGRKRLCGYYSCAVTQRRRPRAYRSRRHCKGAAHLARRPGPARRSCWRDGRAPSRSRAAEPSQPGHRRAASHP